MSNFNESPRLLAVIPARGGSKRLPGKNIRKLGDRPLIAWSIETARECGLFCDVIVSTDDVEISKVAQEYGATVPFLRPKELATDTAGSLAVLKHALEWYVSVYGEVDGVALFQPTSPFRSKKSVSKAVSDYIYHGCRQTLVTVSPTKSHPAWCFQKTGNNMKPYLGWDLFFARSQELPPAYVLNGSIYIIPPHRVMAGDPILSDKTLYFLMEDEKESVDIDTQHDWDMAVFFETKATGENS